MSWIEQIDEIVSERHLLKHPFYTAWTEGRLTLDALRGYAAQYYKHVAAFPQYVSAAHSCNPDPAARRYLLENLIDEERGDESHPELWLRFAEGIGCTRDEIQGAKPLRETKAADRRFRRVAKRGPIAGLASLYAYESMVPAVAASKIEGLKRHYGIDEPDTLRFFTVHLEVDERHTQVARDLLEPLPKKHEVAVEAASETLDAVNGLLDGVVRAYCPEIVT